MEDLVQALTTGSSPLGTKQVAVLLTRPNSLTWHAQVEAMASAHMLLHPVRLWTRPALVELLEKSVLALIIILMQQSLSKEISVVPVQCIRKSPIEGHLLARSEQAPSNSMRLESCHRRVPAPITSSLILCATVKQKNNSCVCLLFVFALFVCCWWCLLCVCWCLRCLLFDVCCLLFVVCCLLFLVPCLLFVVCETVVWCVF